MSFALTPDQMAAGREFTLTGQEVAKLQQRRMDNIRGAYCPKLEAELVDQQRALTAKADAAWLVFKGDVARVSAAAHRVAA